MKYLNIKKQQLNSGNIKNKYGEFGIETLRRENDSPLKLKGIKVFKNFYGKLLLEDKKLNSRTIKSIERNLTTSNHFLVFDIVSPDGKFIERKVFQSDRTAGLNRASERGR